MSSVTSPKQNRRVGKTNLFVASIASAVVFVLAIVIGCANESPKLVPLPIGKKERVKDLGGTKVSFNRAVDILFVIDDSGSMGDHQANLAKNVKLFTQSIINNQILDYHIGVLTSNMDSEPFNPAPGVTYKGELWGVTKFVTRQTPNAQLVLESNLQPGTSGSSTEVFFTPVQAALTNPLVSNENAGFYRSDAYLVVVFVTDADDQSQMKAADFQKFLVNLKGGDPTKVIAYGAYIPTVDTTCRTAEDHARKIEEFFALVGGKTLGLCDVDFGTKLADLGADLVKRIGSVLTLSRPAQADTIVVSFGSQVIPNDPYKGWVFDPVRNAISFGEGIDLKPEPPGTEVEVDFIAAQF